MNDERQTLAQFIAKHGIRATAEYGSNKPIPEVFQNAYPWTVTLRRKRKQMTLPFYMGSARTEEPDAEAVLDCLALDASGLDSASSFEDWCAGYGYDTDSRKAERTYRDIKRLAGKLKAFLGDEAYEELLYETEGL
jgi:hypothetical protein